ncbi:hypothetical protein Tco_1028216 [Tanacetum coccineum]|uniref:Uncharacterized protein n=1 Tax=Tanacetum coccineum TaxID=301880 RepID=A0ABQ5FZY4_9ASTR
MAQPQRQADVHQDELCPSNKRYALMDANKKINLNKWLHLNESKILGNILQNHPLRFSIAASSSIPWIYLGQFWHTLKEDGSKYRLSFMLDRKELTLTLDDFRTYSNCLKLQTTTINALIAYSNFKQTRSRTTVADTMQDVFKEGLQYSLEHPSTLIPYPRFTKLIVSHYMTAFLEISRRVHDKYHNLEDDEMVKSIFNSGKNKAGVVMKIPSWMITDEMKLTEHYRMYDAMFGVDVPMSQSQPIESTQGTHRITSTHRIPNPDEDEGDSTKQNVKKVDEHLIAEEIEKLVEGTDNVGAYEFVSSTLRKNDNQNDPDIGLEPKSNKESPEVEITTEVQPVNVNEEEEELAEDDYELKRREKWKNVAESRHTPSPITIRSPRIHSTLISLDTKKL